MITTNYWKKEIIEKRKFFDPWTMRQFEATLFNQELLLYCTYSLYCLNINCLSFWLCIEFRFKNKRSFAILSDMQMIGVFSRICGKQVCIFGPPAVLFFLVIQSWWRSSSDFIKILSLLFFGLKTHKDHVLL